MEDGGECLAAFFALTFTEKKQEENDGVTMSSKQEDLVECTLCGVSIGVSLLALEGVLSTMGTGAIGQGTEMTLMLKCSVRLSCLLMVQEKEDLMA
eukprot:13199352-Ditylum_brightwellii.AAC.1